MCTITLAMIIKNEETVLERCLQCASPLVDEVVIVDTGSSDRSVEIAKQFTDRVYSFAWIDDFAAARNYAFSLAQMDYILWLDADDIITPENQQKFLDLKQNLNPQTDIVMMKYHVGFDAQGNPTFSYYRERLIRNSEKFRWEGAVHEAITPSGVIHYADIAITHQKCGPHDSDRNLRIFEKLLREGKQLSLREQYYYARELYYHKQYEAAIQRFNDCIAHKETWIENRIDACHLRSDCYNALGDRHQALCSLLESFVYDVPRAEICCAIAMLFLQENNLDLAIYWYEQARACTPNETSGAFVQPDCYNFIPNLQLSVCYDRKQEYEKALAAHQRAAACKPNHPLMQKKAAYFQTLPIANKYFVTTCDTVYDEES